MANAFYNRVAFRFSYDICLFTILVCSLSVSSCRCMLTHVSVAHPFSLFFLLSSMAIGVRGGVFTLTMARLNLRLRSRLFRTLMTQEIAFFDENHTGNEEAHPRWSSVIHFPKLMTSVLFSFKFKKFIFRQFFKNV